MVKDNCMIVENNQNQFRDAEHLWFWFISASRIRNGFQNSRASDFRPCELLDVETLVTKMYLAGSLSSDELNVMKKYGELRRIPNQHAFSENKDAALWMHAMRSLGRAACGRGWIG